MERGTERPGRRGNSRPATKASGSPATGVSGFRHFTYICPMDEYLEFRRARPDDAVRIMEIIRQAQAQMRALGSLQWQDGYPAPENIDDDIARGYGYVLERRDGQPDARDGAAGTTETLTEKQPTEGLLEQHMSAGAAPAAGSMQPDAWNSAAGTTETLIGKQPTEGLLEPHMSAGTAPGAGSMQPDSLSGATGELPEYLQPEGILMEELLPEEIQAATDTAESPGKVIAYGAVAFDGEQAYDAIEGTWLTGGDYVVLHRLAVADGEKGRGRAREFMQRVEAAARRRGVGSFRVDTNFDNRYMLRLLARLGFVYCGKVRYRSGERLAFEKPLGL